MEHIRAISEGLFWVGANDRRLTRFENIHPIAHGVSYNSYLLLDEKTALMDTVDWAVGRAFFENVTAALGGRGLDYLVVHHVEPDHAATLQEVLLRWPGVTVAASAKAFTMLDQFGFSIPRDRRLTVAEGSVLPLGRRSLTFYAAPMVHWPEVLVSYEESEGILFSADAFGAFGALDGKLFADEFDFTRDILPEARRYYANIVGKYGPQTTALLKKAAGLDIRLLCPLHGPVWRRDIGCIVEKQRLWAAYEPEEAGVVVIYASIYGNTEGAAERLCGELAQRGIANTRLYDVSSTDVSYLIAEIFRASHLVLAGSTYNLGLFPPMENLLHHMAALGVRDRTCAVVENGSWALRSGALTVQALRDMKGMTVLEPVVSVTSALNGESLSALTALADALAAQLKGGQ